MKKVIRLTESDLVRLTNKVIKEQITTLPTPIKQITKSLGLDDVINMGGVNYSVKKLPTGKFKIFVTTPKYKTPVDASSAFGQGTMWKEYATQQEAQNVINSIVDKKGKSGLGIDPLAGVKQVGKSLGLTGIEEQVSNKKVVRLTESDLVRLVNRVIKEQSQVSPQLRSRSMTGSDKMMDAVKPSSLTNLVNQSQGSAVKPTSATAKPINSNLKSTLEKLVGVGTGKSYQEICKVCNQQTNLDINNPRAKKAAREFAQAIKGLESTFSNFGGSGPFADKDSSAFKAGQALEKNLENAEDICTTIKYYNSYGGGEEFCEAVRGELKYKFDSSSNSDELIGIPIYRILMGKKIMSAPGNRR
jgi:hypothetical protein